MAATNEPKLNSRTPSEMIAGMWVSFGLTLFFDLAGEPDSWMTKVSWVFHAATTLIAFLLICKNNLAAKLNGYPMLLFLIYAVMTKYLNLFPDPP